MKKAEVSVGFLITTILIILGAALIFGIYSIMNPKDMSDKTACKTSVLLRASAPETMGISDKIPLNCKTKKICIRKGNLISRIFSKAECEEFSGAKDVITKNAETKEDVEMIIAREMAECWDTMGEGKIPLFIDAKLGKKRVKSHCVIYSRIAFDKELKKDPEKLNLNKIDMMKYLNTHEPPGHEGISYVEYLRGRYTTDLKKIIENNEIKEEIKTKSEQIKTFEEPPTKEIAVIYTQIYAPTWKEAWSKILKSPITKAGGAIGAVQIIRHPIKVIKGTFGILKSIPFILIATAVELAHTANIKYNMYIASIRCNDFIINNKKYYGCSSIRVVPYDPEEIKQYCDIIEGSS